MTSEEVSITELDKYKGRDQTLSSNTARVSALVEMAAGDMQKVNTGEKIPLTDMVLVRDAADRYLRDCVNNGVLPTVGGCARSMGVTRQSLYDAAKKRPGSEFSRWLEDFSDICGEIMAQAALEGTVAPVPAIFVLKSRYQWREAPAQVEIGKINPITDIDTEEAAKEIAMKYAALPED